MNEVINISGINQVPGDNKISSEERDRLAKKYSRTHQILSLTGNIIFFAVLLILIFTGLSKEIERIAFGYTTNNYLALLIFFGIIGAGQSLINFPLDFYSGYILEHKYDLSNQTITGYFKEKFKGFALGIIIGIPLMFAFYYILSNSGDMWWLVLGIVMFVFSILLGRIAPTVIMPLFYKFVPVENEDIKNRLTGLCKKTGVKVQGIFTFDMSKNTKKANAAFTGMGKSRRIILGDTLMNNFSVNEIETVFAHEVGHYTKRHILKMMTVSTLVTFIGLFVTAKLYEASLGYFGFTAVNEIAALPLLFLYLSLYGLVTTPISNIQSRMYEWEADTFALETTKDRDSFISAMEKLAGQNLADKTPNKVIEFLFHSHPSLDKRIQFARDFRF
ncbi:MAG TPA: M48 family metallopeptidase [Ignavibacteria bacterium]|nr:M48 family metallopeptidase [Ignavibacteria bacterium]HMR39502.1 M48 family metallopeptidase [Ignavibacteria bacterium]